ncbi:hypothetical protein GCM10007935_17570 [Hydrogenophaga electricum]|uniref:TonB-dependent receptor-like beta-barrel domain-containing protein n=1 Tax=Hydrogenophaga electricum TaxID=1230953 RepID=A0ABQ6C283_9BURK|nr:hypothetical protein GCM10007935_17570 [Hydrogenophaga electricum]
MRRRGHVSWHARWPSRFNRDWSLAPNAKNLFDKLYYQTLGTPRGGNGYGEPRSVALTLRGSF